MNLAYQLHGYNKSVTDVYVSSCSSLHNAIIVNMHNKPSSIEVSPHQLVRTAIQPTYFKSS